LEFRAISYIWKATTAIFKQDYIRCGRNGYTIGSNINDHAARPTYSQSHLKYTLDYLNTKSLKFYY